jgi:hypothetical protein
VKLDARQSPDSYRAVALSLCGETPHCTVMGWTDAGAKPAVLPLTPPQMAAMSFSYLRDRQEGLERTLWNCTEFRRTRQVECMKRATPILAEPVASGTAPLAGVRRRAGAPLTNPRTVPRPAPTADAGPDGSADGR